MWDSLTQFLKRDPPPRVPLGIALARYWPWLSGMALFPIVFLVWDYRTIPQWLFLPLLFLSAFLAWWPQMAGDAPRSFWYVAATLFFATTLVGVIIALGLNWEPVPW